MKDGSTAISSIDSKSLWTSVRSIGLDLIGYERISSSDRQDHATWHLLDPNRRDPGPLGDPLDQWSAIGNIAHMKELTDIAVIAKHIAFSLRTSAIRLRDISREYAFQNKLAVREAKPNGHRFTNVEIFDLFVALHSFLTEMCSARDYLAQFISSHIFILPKHTTMHALYRTVKRNTTPSAIGGLILDAYDSVKPQDWLAQLSRLRNQTVHEEPIRSLVETKLLTVKELETSLGPFLTIYLGVPTDLESVTNKAYLDALSYFKHLMVQMLQFSQAIAAASPVPPEIPQIPASDLL
jgi:hypothetical protein